MGECSTEVGRLSCNLLRLKSSFNVVTKRSVLPCYLGMIPILNLLDLICRNYQDVSSSFIHIFLIGLELNKDHNVLILSKHCKVVPGDQLAGKQLC